MKVKSMISFFQNRVNWLFFLSVIQATKTKQNRVLSTGVDILDLVVSSNALPLSYTTLVVARPSS